MFAYAGMSSGAAPSASLPRAPPRKFTAPIVAAAAQAPQASQASGSFGALFAATVRCGCALPGKRLQVKKEGGNKGRWFYVCPKQRDQQCNFFEWADESCASAASSVSAAPLPPLPAARSHLTAAPAPLSAGPPPPSGQLTPEQYYEHFVDESEERLREIETFDQGTPEWLESRTNRLSGSISFVWLPGKADAAPEMWSAWGPRNKYSTPNAQLKDKLWNTFKGNKFTRYGSYYEDMVRVMYQARMMEALGRSHLEVLRDGNPCKAPPPMRFHIEENGLVVGKETPWFGCSPDGVVHSLDTQGRPVKWLLEIKCPQKLYEGIPPQYFDQIQALMGCMKLPFCDFVQWTPEDGLKVDRVPYDAEHWEQRMRPGLEEFYFKRLLPALTHKHNGNLDVGETTPSMNF